MGTILLFSSLLFLYRLRTPPHERYLGNALRRGMFAEGIDEPAAVVVDGPEVGALRVVVEGDRLAVAPLDLQVVDLAGGVPDLGLPRHRVEGAHRLAGVLGLPDRLLRGSVPGGKEKSLPWSLVKDSRSCTDVAIKSKVRCLLSKSAWHSRDFDVG